MQSQPEKEHQWLQQLVGEWSYEGESTMAPGKPSEKFSGTESVRSIGGLWVVAEGQGQMPDGAPATMIMTLGYDAQRQRFVGTWIGSMMPKLWIYEGALDGQQKVLALDSDGPSMTDQSKTVKYRDAIEMRSPDQRVMTSSTLGDDGQWTGFMTVHYRRKK